MVYRKKQIKTVEYFEPRIRWVRNANMWLRVSVEDGKIVHKWASKKEDLENAPLVQQIGQ